MNVRLTGTLARAIRNYTGCQLVDLEVIPDPHLPGVFAVRARTQRAMLMQEDFFLVRVPLHKATENDLEEVSFTTWPPSSIM